MLFQAKGADSGTNVTKSPCSPLTRTCSDTEDFNSSTAMTWDLQNRSAMTATKRNDTVRWLNQVEGPGEEEQLWGAEYMALPSPVDSRTETAPALPRGHQLGLGSPQNDDDFPIASPKFHCYAVPGREEVGDSSSQSNIRSTEVVNSSVSFELTVRAPVSEDEGCPVRTPIRRCCSVVTDSAAFTTPPSQRVRQLDSSLLVPPAPRFNRC
ncbi:hypothetical protein TRVL_08191 [Trypanosoma vivax]|nr:hypothetical protein TRVL_08191 [Trypanosoma vivax]